MLDALMEVEEYKASNASELLDGLVDPGHSV